MRVVFALDDSEDSMAAVHCLASLPFDSRPQLTIVTALTGTPFDLVKSEKGVELHEAEKERARENFSKAKSTLDSKFERIEFVVERKHPNQLIMEVAKESQADLIALGARGHSAAYRALLGSTADFIVNHARCPVLLIRPKPVEQDNETVGRSLRLLLAYDGTPPSMLAAEQLQSLDWPEGTQIHIATMLERPKLVPEEVVYDPNLVAESNEALSQLEQKSKLKCCMTHSVRETLHIGNSIVTTAESKESDLLFVGSSDKSLMFRFFLGSTSRFVLHHAKCSVWIAKEKHWE